MQKFQIGIIFGGRSGEHEVSLVSATSIINTLNKKKYHVIPIGITKQGLWVTDYPYHPYNPYHLLEQFKQGKIKGGSKLPPDILTKVDVVFPVLHGTYGEDGTIQGLFEMLNIPYVGAGVLASAIGMDKVVQKELFERAELPVVKYRWFRITNPNNLNNLNNLKLRYPLFIKPANLGSSVGITKVKSRGELMKAIRLAAKYDRKIIIEEGVKNAREIECSVLGNDNPQASLPGEVIPSREFYDYEAKYIDSSKTIAPAKLPKKLIKKIQNLAIAAYKAIDCRGMARVDFLVGTKTKKQKNKKTNIQHLKSNIYVSEINTIPGFTAISMYPKLWQVSGLSYSKLLDRLISLALEAHHQKQKLLLTFKPSKAWYR